MLWKISVLSFTEATFASWCFIELRSCLHMYTHGHTHIQIRTQICTCMYKVAKKSAYKWCPDKELGRMETWFLML